jgi:3-isopropylmalate dehydrogenase
MFLSAAMMLDWLGERHAMAACARAAGEIRSAVRAAFATGAISPTESGGQDGTAAIVDTVYRALESGGVAAELTA